jgi:ribosomal protein S12 methylthiotransferase
VFVDSDKPLKPGQLVRVTVTDADEYDLYATVVDD